MIDCHTHLISADFDADRAEVVARARSAGVTHIAVVGQDLAEDRAVLRAAREAPWLLPFLGLHPDRFADDRPAIDPAQTDAICALIEQHAGAICGIGEVGLDRWVCRDEGRRELQREGLRRMIALARRHDLPLNVHSRSAGRYTIDLLLAEGATRVLMHAYDGKPGHAQRAAEAGYLFSIPPSVVRSPQKQKLVRALPLQALALETDAPVLGPEKGVRNEPANVRVSLRAIAELKRLDAAEVAAQTTANARRLFRLEDAAGTDAP